MSQTAACDRHFSTLPGPSSEAADRIKQDANAFAAHTGHQFSLDRLLGDQPDRPARLPGRRRSTDHSDDLLLLTHRHLRRRSRPGLVIQRALQASLPVPLGNLVHGVAVQLHLGTHPGCRLPPASKRSTCALRTTRTGRTPPRSNCFSCSRSPLLNSIVGFCCLAMPLHQHGRRSNISNQKCSCASFLTGQSTRPLVGTIGLVREAYFPERRAG